MPTPEKYLKQKKQYYVDNQEAILSQKASYYHRNKSKIRAKQTTYRKSAKGKATSKRLSLEKNYGISIEKYNTLFTAQNGNCAICGVNRAQLSQDLSVDHCHTSNKVRGLLCASCNSGLGYFKDNHSNLKKAAEYLTR